MAGVPRPHWLPFLVSKCQGDPGRRALCDERALDIFKSLWRRPEKPTIAACYDDLKLIAKAEGLGVQKSRGYSLCCSYTRRFRSVRSRSGVGT
ncbi:DNA-binding domain-containing protein [Komagataeibacter swingsii]|uniref:Mu DNA binding I gamma subdomain domain-containing protein n=1 Tax=Komagataeibacter swingsii TaxID=215220 RepID=A0A2V4QXT4_9PROT|nr:hypothetical protein CFR76_16035 [Komagataeibacter swingsii]